MVLVWEDSDPGYRETWRQSIALEETLKTRDASGWSDVVETSSIGIPHGPYAPYRLVGIALMDLKQFDFPPAIDFWDGRERLTQNALSFAETDMRSQLLTKLKIPKSLPHLSILGSSGRGRPLLDIMRRIASNCKSNMMAVEAMKPLDSTFYCKYGFWSTTAAFYPIDESNMLMPMFHKFTAIEECPFLPAEAFEFNQFNESKATRPVINYAIIENANIILQFLSTFLWKTKNHDDAAESLRRITVRQMLSPSDASKLWRMRLHCLAYKTSEPVECATPITESWFKSRPLKPEVIAAIKKAVG
jgi:hypothetical protein